MMMTMMKDKAENRIVTNQMTNPIVHRHKQIFHHHHRRSPQQPIQLLLWQIFIIFHRHWIFFNINIFNNNLFNQVCFFVSHQIELIHQENLDRKRKIDENEIVEKKKPCGIWSLAEMAEKNCNKNLSSQSFIDHDQQRRSSSISSSSSSSSPTSSQGSIFSS